MKQVCEAHPRVIVPAGNTAPFKEISQRWSAVGNIVFDLTDPRFEPQTSCSRDKSVTARPIGRSVLALKKSKHTFTIKNNKNLMQSKNHCNVLQLKECQT